MSSEETPGYLVSQNWLQKTYLAKWQRITWRHTFLSDVWKRNMSCVLLGTHLEQLYLIKTCLRMCLQTLNFLCFLLLKTCLLTRHVLYFFARHHFLQLKFANFFYKPPSLCNVQFHNLPQNGMMDTIAYTNQQSRFVFFSLQRCFSCYDNHIHTPHCVCSMLRHVVW